MKTKITTTSAVELSKTQRAKLERTLKNKYPSVEFFYEVKPAVLGGVSLTIGSKKLDGTLKYKLTKIQQALLEE